jgi:hypothetical protein
MVHLLAALLHAGQVLPSIEGNCSWLRGMQSDLAPEEGDRSSSSSPDLAAALQGGEEGGMTT